MHEMKSGLLSVIICNYNYERYVGAAISSALAIDWPDVEVIVVDDGSIDGSTKVIETFVPRGVIPLFRQNRGQAAAAADGYRHSRGEWILFLDADDVVGPSIVHDAVAAMKPGWSMIQFQMKVIDENGKPLDSIFPMYRNDSTPSSIRRWVVEVDNYPTPPNSGNLLARQFLDKIFPLEEGMDRFVDSYFLSTAPLLGDVLTVRKAIVSYRMHGSNDGAQSVLDIGKIERDLTRHLRRCRYSARIAEQYGVNASPERWRFGFYNMSMRLASLRLAPSGHPIAGDTVFGCMKDLAIAVTREQGFNALRHVAMATWLFGVAIVPQPIARALVSWRFAPLSRPRLLKRLIQAT
ncbi:glycosyltransferase family 2 protein [Bradyrhizobium sp. JYMT SZCCT0428]|uniref:glycosyltransferase family 2 protein n=1 Tax=Bradyrhizobium sp. JYMT SZCCT0428 TaxID=2807673 RepID=UPI001BAA3849|nr:glycosyltransferase family 2 protein [Bradyrhizobium sp. JYMT SZCCT0428]MBR1151583.1 glycosyltransferase family 2 protein [Bradyrhizobium sp. JYMT SZCCT0428]